MARHGAAAGSTDGRPVQHDPLTPDHDWLADRLAAAPDSLRRAVRARVGSAAADSASATDILAAAAVERLEALLASGDDSRAIATELLAIDALVTWACEAAADRWSGEADAERLVDWCKGFAQRLAAAAAAAPGQGP